METSTSSDDESNPENLMNEESESININESLDFSTPWHFSDVILVVEGTKFHVHKSILSMWSSVFQAMFTSQFMESAAQEIPLPGKRATEVEVLLQVIYSTWTKPVITAKNYQFLVQLADEYQMDRVKKLCSEFLVNMIKESNCLKFFKFAERYGLEDVTEKCFQEVCYNSSADLEGSESFIGLEPKLKVDICMSIIKELERTLQEYVTACSNLIEEVYEKVFMKVHNGRRRKEPKEHIREHKSQQRKLKRALAKAAINKEKQVIDPDNYNSEAFEFSCSYCIKRVEEIEWNYIDSYSILKEPLIELCVLQQENKVARKAKEMAEETQDE